MVTLPGALLRSLGGIVGALQALTGVTSTAGFAGSTGHSGAMRLPSSGLVDTVEVAAVLALCTGAKAVVPQGEHLSVLWVESRTVRSC